jgi:hypothetical protein
LKGSCSFSLATGVLSRLVDAGRNPDLPILSATCPPSLRAALLGDDLDSGLSARRS